MDVPKRAIDGQQILTGQIRKQKVRPARSKIKDRTRGGERTHGRVIR